MIGTVCKMLVILQIFQYLIFLLDLIATRPASAFNIDEEFPIVISNSFDGRNAHFGASVMLLKADHGRGDQFGSSGDDITGWVIIGAPKANSTNANHSEIVEPGVIWRCSLGRHRRNREICQVVDVDPVGEYDPKDRGQPYTDKKDGGWLGGAMYAGASDRFVTCASRWVSKKFTDLYLMNGMCYWIPKSHVTAEVTNSTWPWLPPKYSYRLSPLLNHTRQMYNQSIYDWAYGQFGFSVHITSNNEMIIGSVGTLDWRGSVAYFTDTSAPRSAFSRYNAHPASPAFSEVIIAQEKIDGPYLDLSSYFGYSVTSGKFFRPEISKNRTQFAVGAPRSASLSGQVLVFSLTEVGAKSNGSLDFLTEPLNGDHTTKGNHYGSYFGATVVGVDVTGDGYDDLLVGAPLYGTTVRFKRNTYVPQVDELGTSEINGTESEAKVKASKMKNGDEGCVFVYFSTGEDFLRNPQALCGDKLTGSRFGMAISSLSDINSDGFNDIAVGAPYENDGRGAVYVYHGGSQFLALAQKLTPEIIDTKIRTFGWSLSTGVDIDDNGFPDLAVGAYESNQVVIYRTIPIIKFDASLTASIPKLLSTTEDFNLTSCISYTGKSVPALLNLWVKLTVEVVPDVRRLVSLIQPETNVEPVLFEDGGGDQPQPAFLRSFLVSQQSLLSFRREKSCYNFTAIRTGTVDGLTRVTTIRQEYWMYGANSENGPVRPIYYDMRPHNFGPSNRKIPTVSLLRSKSDFRDFAQTKIPLPVDNMFGTVKLALPVGTICEADGNPECLADLVINASLLDQSKSALRYSSGMPFLLGSADVVTLEIELTNYREAANLPITVGLQWTFPPTVRRLPSICASGNTSAVTDSYVCSIPRALKEFQNEVLAIELDLSKIYGSPSTGSIDIHINATSSSRLLQHPTFQLLIPLKSKMNPQNFSHEAPGVEYSLNTSVPTFGIPQAFEIGLEGPSTAAAVLIEFDIPVKVMIQDSFHELITVRRPSLAYDGDINCRAVNSAFFDDQLKMAAARTDPGLTTTTISSAINGSNSSENVSDLDQLSYFNENYGVRTLDEGTRILLDKFRRVTRAISSAFTLQTVRRSVEDNDEEVMDEQKLILRLNCNSSKVACLRVSCIATHFTPAKKAVVEFRLRMFNNVSAILLDPNNHDEDIAGLWIETVGTVQTLDSGGQPFGSQGSLFVRSELIIPPPYELPAWILIVSVAGGLLSLTIVTIILMKCGFFRRSKLDELRQKKMEMHLMQRSARYNEARHASQTSTSSTARARTSSSSSSSRRGGRKSSRRVFSTIDLDPNDAGGGSILGITSCTSPGTLAKQRHIPGAVDLHELRMMYASIDQNELY